MDTVVAAEPEAAETKPPTNEHVADDGATAAGDDYVLAVKFGTVEMCDALGGQLMQYIRELIDFRLPGTVMQVVPDSDALSFTVKEVVLAEEELFVVDTTPVKSKSGGQIVPSYKKGVSKVLDGTPVAVKSTPRSKKIKTGQTCWNCGGEHALKDCKEQRNFAKIRQKKEEFMRKTDRYHLDLEQQYANLVPGHLSMELRHAMGLEDRDLPAHVYLMRLYGYPPGWLEDAKITHSGLQMFDSNGTAVLESDESEGETANIRVKYDTRKIIAFSGFNTPPKDGMRDDSKYFGVPPYNDNLSRDEMIRNLGNTVGGYRKKKLKPTAAAVVSVVHAVESAKMELDDIEGGEIHSTPKVENKKTEEDLEDGEVSDDDVVEIRDDSVIIVEQQPTIISLDDTQESQLSSNSLSMSDLKQREQDLLAALSEEQRAVNVSAADDDVLIVESTVTAPPMPPAPVGQLLPPLPPPLPVERNIERPPEPEDFDMDEIQMSKLPYIDDPGSVGLKQMSLGTPILTAFSAFNRLPSGDAFSQGVSDVINFENLPNSTGKYERMKSLLSKVREKMHGTDGTGDTWQDVVQ